MELLIVLAIVGVLSALALSGLAESRASVRDGKRVIELSDISRGLYLYAQDRGAYPEALEELIEGAYVSRIPRDPKTEKPLFYAVSSSRDQYFLGTSLESRRSGFLQHDADTMLGSFKGNDLTGCDGAFGAYCFDITAPLP